MTQATTATATSTTSSAATLWHVRALPEGGLQGWCVCQEQPWVQRVSGLHEQHYVHENFPWTGSGPPVVPPDHQHYQCKRFELSSVRSARWLHGSYHLAWSELQMDLFRTRLLKLWPNAYEKMTCYILGVLWASRRLTLDAFCQDGCVDAQRTRMSHRCFMNWW